MLLPKFYVRWLGMETSCKFTCSCFTLQSINISSRISPQRILRCMVCYLCPSSSAVTKQQFLSQLATMNIGSSMLQSATFIIMSDVHMELGSSCLAFYLYPKVPFYLPLLLPSEVLDLFLLADKAQAETVEFQKFWQKLFHISLSLILELLHAGEKTPEVFWCPDGHYRQVIWHIRPYMYSWLPWAGIVDVHHTRLVSSVSHPGIYGLLYSSHLPL